MGLMNSALQIGRNALLGYQSALQVVGSNISGAGDPNYTRLTPKLESLQSYGGGLQPGAGVALSDIQRNIDRALEDRIRLASADVEGLAEQQVSLAQIETFFDDVSGAGVSSLLTEFFLDFGQIQSEPEKGRELIVQKGQQLADALHTQRKNLSRLGRDIDGRISELVDGADTMIRDVADLNVRITAAEARGRGPASGLRDQRSALLRRFGELFDVTVHEQPNGVTNVYIGSEAVVQGGTARGLTAVTRTKDGFERTEVLFADSGAGVRSSGGRIAGMIRSRDEHAYGRVADVDALAATIIEQVNRVHADGQGLEAFTSLTGTTRVQRTDVPLGGGDAGLPFTPVNGSFQVVVTDTSSRTLESTANVVRVDLDGLEGDDTTLESLVAQLDGIDHLNASITPDNRLSLSADPGFTFSFGHDGAGASKPDTSGALAALGVNTFFGGSDASDIAVRDELQRDGNLLAVSSTNQSGDAGTAVRLFNLRTEGVERLGGRSIQDEFDRIANDVAVTASAANSGVDAATAIQSALQAQKESISGVSLDEEGIQLVRFERAFQGAARYVSAVDDMITEIMNLAL